LNPLGDPALVQRLADRKVTAFSMEMIPRTSRAQSMDALSSQGNVAGYKAVLIAAAALPKYFPC
jgi:NAD/NADP transhydrogenase alpha subunit